MLTEENLDLLDSLWKAADLAEQSGRASIKIAVRRRCQGRTTQVLPGLMGNVLHGGSRKCPAVVRVRCHDIHAMVEMAIEEHQRQWRSEATA